MHVSYHRLSSYQRELWRRSRRRISSWRPSATISSPRWGRDTAPTTTSRIRWGGQVAVTVPSRRPLPRPVRHPTTMPVIGGNPAAARSRVISWLLWTATPPPPLVTTGTSSSSVITAAVASWRAMTGRPPSVIIKVIWVWRWPGGAATTTDSSDSRHSPLWPQPPLMTITI